MEKSNKKFTDIDNLISVKYVGKYKKSLCYKVVKRFIDVVGAMVGILILSPVMIVVAILIKLQSKGSVIFGHARFGKRGKFIKVYKFRSMYRNAEKMIENFTPEQKKEFKENFKLKNDPRITPIGNFLRKTSLDELPQLFNVLVGNMSLVGPRPIVEKEIEKYGKHSKTLLSVKPGVTGLWQVRGRSDTTYEERVALDMKYIKERTTWMDIKIIVETFVVVLKKKGAR